MPICAKRRSRNSSFRSMVRDIRDDASLLLDSFWAVALQLGLTLNALFDLFKFILRRH
jgi:hypothetical protein